MLSKKTSLVLLNLVLIQNVEKSRFWVWSSSALSKKKQKILAISLCPKLTNHISVLYFMHRQLTNGFEPNHFGICLFFLCSCMRMRMCNVCVSDQTYVVFWSKGNGSTRTNGFWAGNLVEARV